VTTFTNEDAEQIFEIRIKVEPLAFVLAAQKAGPEDVAELRELTAKARNGAAAQDLAVFFEKHLAYRRRVWELSGNRFLRETLERLVAPLYALYLMKSNFNREGMFQTIEDCLAHQDKTLRAFEGGDSQEAARIVGSFLQQMKDNLGSTLLPLRKD